MIKLYVGNLPFSLDENALSALFSESGEVGRVKIVKDSFDGRSRGFGFVEMIDEAGAELAVKTLDGKEVEGRQMRVAIAKNQTTDEKNQKKLSGAPRPGGNYRQW